jgi:hypothetical protein
MRLSEFVKLVAMEIDLGVREANKDGPVRAFVPEEVELHLSLTMDGNGHLCVMWPERMIHLENTNMVAPVNRCKIVLPLDFSR